MRQLKFKMKKISVNQTLRMLIALKDPSWYKRGTSARKRSQNATGERGQTRTKEKFFLHAYFYPPQPSTSASLHFITFFFSPPPRRSFFLGLLKFFFDAR